MSTFDPPSMFPQLSVRGRFRAPHNRAPLWKFLEPSLPVGVQQPARRPDCVSTRPAFPDGKCFLACRPAQRTVDVLDEDGELLSRIARSDAAAMKTLFSKHQVRVFRFVERMLRNPAIAEELTNEVFLEVWRGAGNFQGRSAVSTWILSIAHKRALNILRKRRELSWNEDDAVQIPDQQDDPEVASQKAGKSALLRKCADALAPLHREIIDLVYYHEMSIREASDILDVPEGTVKARLFNARKKLEVLLTAAGVDRGWP